MGNFKCEDCLNEFLVVKHTLGMEDGEIIYKDGRTKKPLQCEKCESTKIILNREFNGVPLLSKFSLLSKEDKIKNLKQRSSEHSKRTRSIE